MRTIFILLVLTCCLAYSNATLRLLKSKVNSSPLLQKAVEYLASPVIIPDALPATYARPAYTTFSVSLPSVPHYVEPLTTTYVAPHVQESTYVTPGVVYHQPLYYAPETVYVEPNGLATHLVTDHYDEYYIRHLPTKTQTGNW